MRPVTAKIQRSEAAEPAMATRPGQVVSHATSPRKPWRASSRIGVSGLSSGDGLRPADLVVERDVAGGQERGEEDADLEDRAGPLVSGSGTRRRAPTRWRSRPRRGPRPRAASRPISPPGSVGAEHERRGPARTTVVKVARARLGQHRPDVEAEPRARREQQPVVEAGLDVAHRAEAGAEAGEGGALEDGERHEPVEDVVGGERRQVRPGRLNEPENAMTKNIGITTSGMTAAGIRRMPTRLRLASATRHRHPRRAPRRVGPRPRS